MYESSKFIIITLSLVPLFLAPILVSILLPDDSPVSVPLRTSTADDLPWCDDERKSYSQRLMLIWVQQRRSVQLRFQIKLVRKFQTSQVCGYLPTLAVTFSGPVIYLHYQTKIIMAYFVVGIRHVDVTHLSWLNHQSDGGASGR